MSAHSSTPAPADATHRSALSDACVHELFQQTAAQHPTTPALICSTRRLTYHEVNVRANRVARTLRALGVKPEALVAVYLDRSIEAVIALLGVLKAGGGYVPLDPAHPIETSRQILRDARVLAVVTNDSLKQQIPKANARFVSIDGLWDRLGPEDTVNPEAGTLRENVAYVVYTSGSTGTPKGVVRIHQDLIGQQPWARFEAADVCALNLSLAGGFAALRVYLPLVSGAPLVVIPNEEAKDIEAFIRILDQERVAHVALLPSTLRSLLDAGAGRSPFLPALRTVTVGGEPFPSNLLEPFSRVMPRATLFNQYASSETGPVAVGEVSVKKRTAISAGPPVSGTHIYILDERMDPVPNGATGEIYIATPRLARGYLRQPGLTAERFVPNPLGTCSGGRLYRSGDLGRFTSDHEIEYLGRMQHQLNVQGRPIEPHEIEQLLEKHDDVQQAIVTVCVVANNQVLVAYLVTKPGKDPSETSLGDHVAMHLPPSMIPSRFVFLENVPLTRSGKVDRSALPSPETLRAVDIKHHFPSSQSND